MAETFSFEEAVGEAPAAPKAPATFSFEEAAGLPTGPRRGGTRAEAAPFVAGMEAPPEPAPAAPQVPNTYAERGVGGVLADIRTSADMRGARMAPPVPVLERPATPEMLAAQPPGLTEQEMAEGSIAPWKLEQMRAAGEYVAPTRPAEAKPFSTAQNIVQDVREATTNPVARGAVAGFSNLGQTGIGLVRSAADIVGADEVSKFAADTSRTANTIGAGATQGLSGNNKLVADVTASIISSTPAVAIGTIGGPALRALFAQTAAADYAETGDAAHAGIVGAAEALGERFGFPEQIRLLKGVTRGMPAGDIAKVFGAMIAKEIPGEQLTTALEFLGDKYGPGARTPGATFADYLQQAGDTLAVTIGQTAVMGGGPAAISQARNAFAGADASVQRSAQSMAQRAAADAGFIRPTEQRKQAADRLDDFIATHGTNSTKAIDAVKAEAAKKPLAEVVPFYKRAIAALSRRGLIGPVDEPALAALDEPQAPAVVPRETSAPDAQLADRLAGQFGIPAEGAVNAPPDLAASTPVAAGPGDEGVPDAAAGGGTVGLVAPDAARAGDGSASAPDAGSGSSVAAEVGNAADQALTPPASSADITGETINRAWRAFTPESGTLNLPREQLPQIKAEHRGALVQFLGARGITHETDAEVDPRTLKPTQGEFSPAKVKQASEFQGGDRSILVSADGYVLDGHHQWLSKLDAGQPVKVIRLNAPIQDLLRLAHQFPSSTTARGPSRAPTSAAAPADPATGLAVDGGQQPGAAAPDVVPLRVIARAGRTPAAAEPIELRPNPDGTLTPYMGGKAMLDFNSGEPVVVPAGVTDLDAKKAIRDAGSLSNRTNFYPAAKGEAKAEASQPPAPPTPPAEVVAAAPEPRKPSRAERAKARMAVDPATDSMLQALAKMGGIQREVVAREFGLKPEELKHTVATGGLRGFPFRKNGGMGLDAAMTALREVGYFTGVADEDVRAKFEQAIYNELGGGRELTPQGQMRRAADEANDRADTERAELDAENRTEDDAERAAIMADAGVTEAGMASLSDDDIDLDAKSNTSTEAFLRAMGASEQEIADELARQASASQADGAQDRQASGEEASAAAGTGGAEARAGAAGAGEEGLTLTSPTRAEVLAQQAALEQERADREAPAERPKGRLTGEQVDAFSTQGSVFDQPAEAPAPTPAAEQSKPAPSKPQPEKAEKPAPGIVEDFGQKLEGARKDQATSLSKEYSDDDLAREPFSKVWPAAEVDAIEDKFAAAVAHAARAEVPAKPRTSYKIDRWVEKVKGVRSLAQRIVNGQVTRERMLQEFADRYALKDFGAKVRLLEQIDREQWGRIGDVSEAPDAYRYEGDAIISPKKVATPMVRVQIDGKSRWMEGGGAIEDHVDAVRMLLGGPQAEKRMKFEIRNAVREGIYFINKAGDKDHRRLKTFDRVEDARSYIKDHYDDLVAEWEGVKDRDNVREQDVRSETNRPRTAEDWRNGKDVTPEQFGEAFGFRGVQFGNWVAQGADKKARQGMLNQAYDALMDLAAIINVPPKAMSLNGSLGLAFGARGSGWASAHFEPDTLVINLTKTRGAGTLAHEWFHALDNYFSHQRGGAIPMARGMSQEEYRQANYITYRPEPLMVRKDGRGTPTMASKLAQMRAANPGAKWLAEDQWQLDPKHPAGVRPEVEKRFAELVEALDASPMAARVRMIDKSPNGYWSRVIERAARSFENFVISKMMEKGYSNDYLANVREVQDFPRAKERYPYLLPEEVAPVAAAFDDLFSTVKTRETDTGVMMFSAADDTPSGWASVDGGGSEADTSRYAADPDRNHLRIVDFARESIAKRRPGFLLRAVEAPGSRSDLRAARAVARGVAGHKVIFVKQDNGRAFNGAAFGSPGHDYLLIDVDSKAPVMAVTGHEMLHRLRGARPDLYEALDKRIRRILQNESKYADDIRARYERLQLKPLTEDKIHEELVADIFGDEWSDPEFWRELAKDRPTGFRAIVDAVVKFLDDLIAKVVKTRPFGTETYLTDLRAARDAVMEATREFSKGEVGNLDTVPSDLQFSTPANPTPPAETPARAIQRKLQDQFNRFTVVRDWAKEQGIPLSADSNVWAYEERMHGRIATRVQDFREKTLEPKIKAIQKAGFTMAQVAEFLHAQHAEERNKQIESIDPTNTAGSGMTTADAQAILAKAPVTLAALANDFRKIADDTKSILLKAGIINKDMTDAWEATYKHYVPLKGGPDEKAAQTGTGKGLNVAGKQKRALGHAARSEHVIENILRDHERAIALAEKNVVGHSLLAFITELGNPEVATIGQPEKRKVLKNSTDYEVKDGNGQRVAIFDSLAGANQFIAKHSQPGLFGTLKGPLTAEAVKGDPAVAFMSTPMLADNEVNVYLKGHAIRVQLNDPLLARAYTRSGVEHLNQLMAMNREINALFSKVYTGYNPEFLLTNMARDWTTGLINVTGQYGAGISTKAAANYPKAFAQMLRYSMTGKSTPDIDAYRATGGSTGASYLSDLERIGRDVEGAYDEYRGVIETAKAKGSVAASRAAARKFIGHLLGWMEHLNAAGENAMRLAVFEAVRATNGYTDNDAASAAKNSTVNFNRRGEWGPVLGAMYLFFNPAIQGTAAMADSLVNGKHRAQAIALVSALPMLAYFMAASQFGGGDDDDEAWEAMPDADKDKAIVIRTGEKTRVTIPIPYGYAFFYSLGNAIFDLQKGRDKAKVALRTASNLLEHFSPIGNPLEGDKPDARGSVELIPGVIGGELMRHAVRVTANRNSFGGDIVPDSPFDPDKPDVQRLYRLTKGTAYDKVAKALSEATGGTKSLRGAVDLSPETLKYWTRAIIGGAGTTLVDTVDWGKRFIAKQDKTLTEEERKALESKPSEMPILRRFAKEEKVSDRRRLFWNSVEEVKAAQADLERARKLDDETGEQRVWDKRGELISMGGYMKSLTKMVKAQRDLVDEVMADETTSLAYKRARVKALEDEEAKLYGEFVREFSTEKRKADKERAAAR